MRQLETDAMVLHAFDYRETSRILRVVTRDAGVLSVVARGARRPRNRFGSALDLFASGHAAIAMHRSGDLHTLGAFEATRSRPALVASLDRYAAACALAELCSRFGQGTEQSGLLRSAEGALDELGAATGTAVVERGLRACWRIVAELGFAPALDVCASCHRAVEAEADVRFHHRLGGALCDRCAAQSRGGRRIPATARAAVAAWLRDDAPDRTGPPAHAPAALATSEARAHLRLLHEFLGEHLGDGKPLRAFVAWQARAVRRESA